VKVFIFKVCNGFLWSCRDTCFVPVVLSLHILEYLGGNTIIVLSINPVYGGRVLVVLGKVRIGY
jgi:hypothetical protein